MDKLKIIESDGEANGLSRRGLLTMGLACALTLIGCGGEKSGSSYITIKGRNILLTEVFLDISDKINIIRDDDGNNNRLLIGPMIKKYTRQIEKGCVVIDYRKGLITTFNDNLNILDIQGNLVDITLVVEPEGEKNYRVILTITRNNNGISLRDEYVIDPFSGSIKLLSTKKVNISIRD